MSFIMASGAESLSFFQKFGIEWDMLLSQAIMFTLLALILYRFVFRPVSKAADERRVKIEQADAEAAREKLQACERECTRKISAAATEAASIIAKTKDDAKAMIENAAQEASKKASEIAERARLDIENDRLKMKDELKGEIAALVVKTAEAVFADSITPELKSKIADSAVSKLKEM